jgi:hypothetical protein
MEMQFAFWDPFLIRMCFTVNKFRFQIINISSLVILLFKIFKSITTLANSLKSQIYSVLAEMQNFSQDLVYFLVSITQTL